MLVSFSDTTCFEIISFMEREKQFTQKEKHLSQQSLKKKKKLKSLTNVKQKRFKHACFSNAILKKKIKRRKIGAFGI